MTNRFFKLIYVFALIAIGLSFPIFILSEMRFDSIVLTDYKAKCLSNNQYVVLQGGKVGEPDIWNEVFLNSNENRTAIKEQLNFYCKYHDEIQPHIVAYNETKTPTEQYDANIRFNEFRSSKDEVYAYPELYTLEVVDEQFQPYELFSPIIDWLIYAVLTFLILQIARMSYVYVVFSEIVWHPFRQHKNK